jgi:hypothetical protein
VSLPFGTWNLVGAKGRTMWKLYCDYILKYQYDDFVKSYSKCFNSSNEYVQIIFLIIMIHNLGPSSHFIHKKLSQYYFCKSQSNPTCPLFNYGTDMLLLMATKVLHI